MQKLAASSTSSLATRGAGDESDGTDLAVQARRAEHTYLAALGSAPRCSRLFARQVCASWQMEHEQTDVAELLASELVANAVTASRVATPCPICGLPGAEMQFIGVRLLAHHDSVVIEVWDTSPKLPVLIRSDALLEHGRGLQLVDALSADWGYHHTRTGRKVVWCQLAFDTSDLEPGAGSDTSAFEAVLEALNPTRPPDPDRADATPIRLVSGEQRCAHQTAGEDPRNQAATEA
jgi:hypothetical protein